MGNFSSFCFPQLSPNSLYYGFFMCARPESGAQTSHFSQARCPIIPGLPRRPE
ncbi:MAG: hypothetical protein [Olavius algarvensis Gamma 1 endosymbiont]|nr:MAG: hypothetical protein [Olavius algarvensis Gamma 1 endosymbiont]